MTDLEQKVELVHVDIELILKVDETLGDQYVVVRLEQLLRRAVVAAEDPLVIFPGIQIP